MDRPRIGRFGKVHRSARCRPLNVGPLSPGGRPCTRIRRTRAELAVRGDAHMPVNSPELVLASQHGDLSAVRRLVESGADVNSVGEHGTGPLLTFHPVVMEYLLAKG